MKTTCTLFARAVFFLSLVSIAGATGLATDPVIGSWKLNLAKSKFSLAAPKSESRTYAKSDDGVMTVTIKQVGPDGEEYSASLKLKQDGKDYPVEDFPNVDAISEKRIGSHVAEFSAKKGGKVVVTGRRELSNDGKTLTIIFKGTDSKGAKYVDRQVYDRE